MDVALLKSQVQSNRLVQWSIRLASGQGRALASAVLLGVCIVMLLADWPVWWTPLPKSITPVINVATESFTNGRNFLFDRYQRESSRKVQAQPVTIVAIDEKSLADLGQWPWPRHKLADLIRAVNKHAPAAIGLDIYMPERDQTSPGQIAQSLRESQPELARRLLELPSNDQILANSLSQAPSVLGVAGFDFKTYTTSEGLRAWPLRFQGGDALPSFVRAYPAVLASLPLLQSVASGQALLSVDSKYGTVRRMPLLANVNGQAVSFLAVEMFRVALGLESCQVELTRQGVSAIGVGELRIPTQPEGDVYLHFARQSDTINRYVSARDVLAGKVDPEALNGKLVLIGLTGMGLNDMRITALGEHVPGIEIQAQLIESFFDQRFLLRPWWMIFAEIGCTLVFGALMIWLLPRVQEGHRLGVIYRLRMVGVVGSVALNALAIAAGFYLFRHHGLMFDAASFFLATSAVVGMLFTFVQASAARAKESLRQQQWDQLMQRAEQAEAALQAHSTIKGENA